MKMKISEPISPIGTLLFPPFPKPFPSFPSKPCPCPFPLLFPGPFPFPLLLLPFPFPLENIRVDEIEFANGCDNEPKSLNGDLLLKGITI